MFFSFPHLFSFHLVVNFAAAAIIIIIVTTTTTTFKFQPVYEMIFITNSQRKLKSVVVMPRTILPQRNRRCAFSAAGTWKSEEKKEARSVTCFMEENEISLREVARFDKDKRD